MPELPEVERIVRLVGERLISGSRIASYDVVRGKYLGGVGKRSCDFDVVSVYRRGKQVLIGFTSGNVGQILTVHNAMSGYFDWADDPWTFDYVEGNRVSNDSDVRVLFNTSVGVLRFHDARLFGRISVNERGPVLGPELLRTEWGVPGAPVIDEAQFATGLLNSRRPVKAQLMDQAFLAGVGNIYANEACLLSSIDPRRLSSSLYKREIPVLLEALRVCVSFSIPEINYGWLKVYRQRQCGLCSNEVSRCEIDGRATFFCTKCQPP